MKKQCFAWLILLLFLLLKLIAPPTDTQRAEAAVLLGLEKEKIEVLVKEESQREWKSAWSKLP